MFNEATIPANKQDILSVYTQEELMEYFLGIPLVFYDKFTNPFRVDTHPSCGLHYYKEQLFFKDYAKYFLGNWIGVAALYYNIIDINTSGKLDTSTYVKTLNKVKEELIDKKVKLNAVTVNKDNLLSCENQHIIKVQPRTWTTYDRDYWNPIPKEVLKDNHIYPIEYATVNGRKAISNSPTLPLYGYRYSKTSWKIYSPLNEKHKKWKQNIPLNMMDTVGDNYIRVMTTSKKDSILINQFTGWECYNYQSEMLIPQDLKENTVLYLADNDSPGLTAARSIREKFGITVMTTPQFKDPFEFASNNLEEFKKWIIQLKQIQLQHESY